MAALIIKLALYVSALGAAGFALVAATVLTSKAEARGALRTAGLLAVAAAGLAALRFGLDAARLAGGWAHLLEPPYLAWTLEAQAAFLALLAGGVVLLGIAGLLGRRWLAAAGGLAIAASFTATGHVSASPGALWLRLALWPHLVGVAFWLTAPVVLWPARSRDDALVLARVRAFSRIAVGVVPVVLVAGVALAAALIENPADALASAYGRLILLKGAAASVAFAIGAFNKVWVTNRLADDPTTGRAALKATLAADAVLFTTALIAVAAATTAFAP